MALPDYRLLFHILESERSILSRTDQKAFTLLSILGVFMAFFIVYYRFLAFSYFIVVLIPIYFLVAFLTIYNLFRTIMPRFSRKETEDDDEDHARDPTFFGGIRKFRTSAEYHTYMESIGADEERTARLISRQIHTLAIINWNKNIHLRRGMYFFITAIGTELMMILSLFIKMALDSIAD